MSSVTGKPLPDVIQCASEFCPQCREEAKLFERFCLTCGFDLGFPNVRMAAHPAEVAALAKRVEESTLGAHAKGCASIISDFASAAKASFAVLSRSFNKIQEMVSTDNELYASFYQLVGAGAKRPLTTVVEFERQIADDLLFPYYREHIRFAALSLDGSGPAGYGDCTVSLKDVAVKNRATVFEENSLTFCRRFGLGFGRPVPRGHRAVWSDRDKLATAKLAATLSANTGTDEFAEKLIDGDNFIEVHIFGPLTKYSIAAVTRSNATRPVDKLLESEIRRRLDVV